LFRAKISGNNVAAETSEHRRLPAPTRSEAKHAPYLGPVHPALRIQPLPRLGKLVLTGFGGIVTLLR
jgi:hypothetical protein